MSAATPGAVGVGVAVRVGSVDAATTGAALLVGETDPDGAAATQAESVRQVSPPQDVATTAMTNAAASSIRTR